MNGGWFVLWDDLLNYYDDNADKAGNLKAFYFISNGRKYCVALGHISGRTGRIQDGGWGGRWWRCVGK